MSVIRATIEEPAAGTWVADLDVEESDQVTGVFEVGGVEWTGRVIRSRTEGGVKKVRIVGGAPSLGQFVAARSFRETTLPTILTSVLTGTDFSGSAAEADVSVYVLLGGPLGIVLNKLASVTGVDFYVTRSGGVRLDKRTGSEVTADRVATDIEGAVYLNCDSCSQVTPGDQYEGTTVEHVRWRLTPSKLIAEVSFDRILRPADPSLGYELTYAGRIVKQNTDESGPLPTVDVLVAGELGIRSVPLLVGGPFKVAMASDDLCRVGFEAGDPRRPYVLAVVQKGSKRVAREGDTISLGKLAFVDSGAAGPEVLTWTPPPTEDIPIPVPVIISGTPVDIYGVIDQGSDEVKIP